MSNTRKYFLFFRSINRTFSPWVRDKIHAGTLSPGVGWVGGTERSEGGKGSFVQKLVMRKFQKNFYSLKRSQICWNILSNKNFHEKVDFKKSPSSSTFSRLRKIIITTKSVFTLLTPGTDPLNNVTRSSNKFIFTIS